MARIKSAWEIALEKTADIEMDEEKYRHDSLVKEGMTIVGSFLNSSEMTLEQVKLKLKSYEGDCFALVREGVVSVLYSNISLPLDDSFVLRFDRLTQLASVLDESGQVTDIMGQIKEFMSNYLEARNQFAEQMQAQIRQAMQDNPGQVNTSQYTKVIEQKLKQMEDQYQEALDNTKDSLKSLLG